MMNIRLVLVISMALGSCMLATAASSDKCKVALGAPAPDLAGRDLDGGSIDLENYRGKWVYLDFWASWCKPCMHELPNVVGLHQQMTGRDDFAVMSIALDDSSTVGELKKVKDRYKVSYPVVCDQSGWHSSHVQDWCVEAIPTTFLIDPNGRVVERDISPAEVRNYISRNESKYSPAQPPVAPRQQPQLPSPQFSSFNAKHRVMRDSPTSGKRGYRDFQLSLPGPQATGSTRYMIALRTDEGGGDMARIRYDLEFSPDNSRRDFPYSVTIREASGERSTRLPTGEKSTVIGGAVDFLPGAQITYDAKERRLLFSLPLPPGLSGAAYTTSRFNAGSQRFEDTLAADIQLS